MLLLSTATDDSSSRMVASRLWMAKRSWSAWTSLSRICSESFSAWAKRSSTARSASSFWRTASL